RSLVFVVSDFFSASGWEERLRRIARRHETMAVRLADPREAELPDIGPVILTDSETGEQLRVDTHDGGFRARFAAAARRREESLRTTFDRASVDELVPRTDEDLVRTVVRFAHARKRRAARRGPVSGTARPSSGPPRPGPERSSTSSATTSRSAWFPSLATPRSFKRPRRTRPS